MKIEALVPVLGGVSVKIKDKWYEMDLITLTKILNSATLRKEGTKLVC